MIESTQQLLEIIDSCKQGNRKSCRLLYDSFKNSLFAVCLRYFSDRTEAEDALQEAFILIFKNINKFDESKGSFYTWSSKIVVNVILSKLRKNKPLVIYTKDLPTVEDDSFTLPLQNLTMKELVKEIQSLPEGYRRVFNMYVMDGMTHKEIAEEMDISISTSKTQLLYAKRAMQKKLEKLNIFSYVK